MFFLIKYTTYAACSPSVCGGSLGSYATMYIEG